MTNKVSIIIPVYNASQWLKETLECALSQTWQNIEVIAVNDGSTDDSGQILQYYKKEYPGKISVIMQENQGGCVARNVGFAHATGDLIQFWDADDLMDNRKIEVQVKALEKEMPGSLAFCPWYRFLEQPGDLDHGVSPNWKNFNLPSAWLIEHLKGRAMMPPIGWLIPRSVIDKAGHWDESLIINQDGEFISRVILNASYLVCSQEVKVYYRSGLPNSVSRRNSDQKLRAFYSSMIKVLEYAFNHSDDPGLRLAAPCYLQQFIKSTYPRIPETLKEAETYMNSLGKCKKDESFGRTPSKGYRLLERIIGWKKASKLKHFLKS